MKNSLHKMIWRTFLVLACTLFASNAWADDVYSVAGNKTEIFGASWSATNTTTNMTWKDGYYQWTSGEFTVAANEDFDVAYKVITNHEWETYPDYGNSSGGNQTYNDIPQGTYTMTFYLDMSTTPWTAQARLNKTFTVVGDNTALFGTAWAPTADVNDMTWESSGKPWEGVYKWSKKNVSLSAGVIEYKVCQDHTWDYGGSGGNQQISIEEAGTYDVIITYDGTNLTLTAGLVKSLAEICSSGSVNKNYSISDELIAVDYCNDGNSNVFLMCKDQNNASIDPTFATANQTDFLLGDTQAQNNRSWDQSNWIALKLMEGTSAQKIAQAEAAKGHKITGVTGKLIDANNYTLEVDNNYSVGATADYTPNVYCVANFNTANLGSPGAELNGNYYFFMNPKVQEVCEITYAQWNGTALVVPSTSGFTGTLNLDWGFNDGTASLTQGTVYHFKSIVQRNAANGIPGLKINQGESYKVCPTNLTGGQNNIVTGINTIAAGKGEVKAVRYYNLMGVESATPFDGVNIVVKEFSDGTRETSKVVK